MLTETEARELLAIAAATIEVKPGPPVTLTTGARVRRWLPALAAAAAVVLVVAGAAVLLDQPSESRAAPTNPPDPAVPQDGRIPSVFAYSGSAAEDMLTERGLVVTTKTTPTCGETGRAVRTEPDTGTRFEVGDPVTLVVTEMSATAFCVPPHDEALAWQLLDFANDRGPAPWFAPDVAVYLNGEQTTLSRVEATDRSTWPSSSALDALAVATRQEAHRQGFTATPTLMTGRDNGTRFACGGLGLPSELAGRTSLWLSIELPTDGFFGACTVANVYRTEGQVDAIVVRTSGVAAPDTSVPESDPDPDRVAARFLAFARGESDSLPVDTPVRLYLGGDYIKTIQASEVSDPDAWTVCPRFMSMPCQISALATARGFGQQVALTDFLPTGCLNPRSAKPPTDTGGSQMVVLGLPEPATCKDDFLVQVWSNDVGQITAVNLLFGTR
jgi:hypothetical protein